MAIVEPSAERFSNPVAKYVAATRPPFLLASLVPCAIGLATAHHQGIALDWLYAILTVAGALAAHAGVNVLNDYYDALNGTDAGNDERIYPFTGGSRFIQNGVMALEEIAGFGWSLLLFCGLAGLLLLPAAGPGLLLVGGVGLLIGWGYSAPPLALNSRGLGEVAVAAGVGILIPVGADLVQRGEVAVLPAAAGLSYALLAAALLYINQFPDRKADAAAGKRHWVVRLGSRRGRWIYAAIVLLAHGALGLLVLRDLLPAPTLLGLLTLPLSLWAAGRLIADAQQPSRLAPAIRATIAAALLHGALVAVGVAIAS